MSLTLVQETSGYLYAYELRGRILDLYPLPAHRTALLLPTPSALPSTLDRRLLRLEPLPLCQSDGC